jgi:hypothetical protein
VSQQGEWPQVACYGYNGEQDTFPTAVEMIKLTLTDDGSTVPIRKRDWPIIASANRTVFTDGGFTTYTMTARRHDDGRVAIYVASGGQGRGVILQSPSNEEVIATADSLPDRPELYQESIDHFARSLTRGY